MVREWIRQSATAGQPQHRSWRGFACSLEFKASLLVTLVILAVGSLGMALSLRAMSIVLYRNDYYGTRAWASSLASGVSQTLESGDRESLTLTANSLIRTRKVAYAVFADASGRVLASGEAFPGLLKPVLPPIGRALPAESLHTPKLVQYKPPAPTCVEVIVPVYSTAGTEPAGKFSRPIVGYLRFAADVSHTKARLNQLWWQHLRMAIAVMLLVIPFTLVVTRHVVAPVNELARTARAIANGSMDARTRVHSRDEIGALAESLNVMADRVAASHMELLELNAELEKRVQQRTRELEELAARDPLTGLYNRRHFAEVVTREFAAAERYDADLTCLMFDLDHFKETNDRFGHHTGDGILIALAQAIADELRGSDVAARFGGDEFFLLLPQTSAEAASMLVERIVSRFTEQTAETFPDVPAGVSVGAASLRTTRAASAEALIREADLALYAAKEGGRSRTMAAERPAAVQHVH